MSSPFVHLHFHTHYSLLDGAIKVKGLGGFLKEKGFSACAITDHGNMHGAIEFYSELKKQGLKPIIGMEAYVADGHRTKRNYPKMGPNASHAVLLAQNKQGYINLGKMASQGFVEGKFYGKPRIDRELLEQYSEGIICLSACLQGELSRRLIEGDEAGAREAAQWYKERFPGRYYVEIQSIGLEKQDKINPKLIEIARDLELPLVGTNDCHYKTQAEAEPHYILQLMGWQKKVTDPGVKELECDQIYIKSPEEMAQAFANLPQECLTNTVKIAEQCELALENKNYYLPAYPVKEGRTLELELIAQAEEGLVKRLDHLAPLYGWSDEERQQQTQIYQDRLAFELQVINQMGFPGYFLIVADFINWSKDNGVPVGPGRGSGAGSLVAYAIRITDIDPIRYGLLFERFLNPDRISMPDFDIDFEVEGRERVIEYVRHKYGEKNVCQISAIGSLQAKGVIRGVARVLDIPYSEADKIAKLVPDELGITLEKAMEKEPQLQQMAESGTEIEKKMIRISRKLEGLNNNLSTHAAGVIIMNSDITDVMPICTPTKGEGIQSMYTMKYAEEQGAVKFDFLGLRNLTVIDQAVRLINQQRTVDQQLDISAISMEDKPTYRLLGRGDTTGVFQLESEGMKKLIQKLKPDCFEDIVALVALYRPGPLGSGMVDDFVERKHGRQKISYQHPLMSEVLRETYGVMVYQEQVMKVVQILAGFSLGQADLLRRAIGKKIPEVLAEQRKIFVEGCLKSPEYVAGCGAKSPEGLAGEIFDLIDYFAGYGFNKSHSAAYALVSYQTAWLKANYPVEFMAALLTADINKPDSIVKLIAECRDMKIKVLPPDVNQSDLVFTTHGSSIRFGLNAIKNVGAAALTSILETRKELGQYKDLGSMFRAIDSSKVNSRVMEALVKSGAFDSLEPNRRKVFEGIETLLAISAAERHLKIEDQVSLFDQLPEEEIQKSLGDLNLPAVPDWKTKERLRFEKEALGFYISGHPLQPYEEELHRQVTLTKTIDIKEGLKEFKRNEKVRLMVVPASVITKISRKNNQHYGQVVFEDQYGSLEAMIFGKIFSESEALLAQDEPIMVTGQVFLKEQGPVLSVQKITALSSIRAEFSKRMTLKIPQGVPPETLGLIKNVLAQYPGECQVLMQIFSPAQSCEVTILLQEKVQPTERLVSQLEDLIGLSAMKFELDWKKETPSAPEQAEAS